MRAIKKKLGYLLKNVIADIAYGSGENFAYLDQEQVENFLKYKTFGKQHRARNKSSLYTGDQNAHDPEKDELTCPAGKYLTEPFSTHRKSDNGYHGKKHCYTVEDCTSYSLNK